MSSYVAFPGAPAPALFIHGSLSSGKMWSPFSSLLTRTRPVLAPDLLGYGASPRWTATGLTLCDEVDRLKSTFDGPVDVVAHSYGAAVALRLLCDEPHSIRSLALIEPACFFFYRT